MNRKEHGARPPTRLTADLGSWSLIGAELPRFSRSRRLRRQVRDHSSDAIWSLLMLLMLGWMALVALTLWH